MTNIISIQTKRSIYAKTILFKEERVSFWQTSSDNELSSILLLVK